MRPREPRDRTDSASARAAFVETIGLIGKPDGMPRIAGRVFGLLLHVDRAYAFADVATMRRTFEDATGSARIDGQPALSLEGVKRSGANIIDIVAERRAVVEAMRTARPDAVTVTYLSDQSEPVEALLPDPKANVIAAVILMNRAEAVRYGADVSLLGQA